MIVFKLWKTQGEVERYPYKYKQSKTWHGWFLFGFIPLYIKMVELVEVRD